MNLITVNNLTPDSACRTFFSNDIHFASFSNAVLFDGKQLIQSCTRLESVDVQSRYLDLLYDYMIYRKSRR